MNAPIESVPPNVHKFAKKLIVFEWFLSAVPYILAASLSDILTSVALPSPLPSTIDSWVLGKAFQLSFLLPLSLLQRLLFTIHFALSTFHSSAYVLPRILRFPRKRRKGGVLF